MSSRISWAVQTLIAYFVPLSSALFLAVRVNEPDTKLWEVASYAFFALAGLILGILVAWLLPASKEGGRWVWAGPVGLLVLGAIWEICLGRFDIITLWFGTGESGWIKTLVTWPALASCTYSAAMEWARRVRSGSSAGTVQGA
jgi:hypothetical protein